jgi:DNA-binding LacI/PurR family transcriptional regulator
VARRAGVSRTTVSLVLNDVSGFQISAATRGKVREAARKLGYVPNAPARALAGSRTHVIGLVFSRRPHHIAGETFLPRVVDGLLDVTRANNLRLLIDIVAPQHQEREYINLARGKRIDGLVLSAPRLGERALRNLEREGLPTVLIGRLPKTEFFSVDVDNHLAARRAAEYLISLGHRRIACIINAPLSYAAAADRLEGYRAALKGAGIRYDPSIVRFGDFSLESGYSRMNELLAQGGHFTAVFTASDTVALGAKNALRETGRLIPDDISLMGMDDISIAKFLDPPLTTVRVPAEALAGQACEMLLRALGGEPINEKHLVLPTELVLRESCRQI